MYQIAPAFATCKCIALLEVHVFEAHEVCIEHLLKDLLHKHMVVNDAKITCLDHERKNTDKRSHYGLKLRIC